MATVCREEEPERSLPGRILGLVRERGKDDPFLSWLLEAYIPSAIVNGRYDDPAANFKAWRTLTGAELAVEPTAMGQRMSALGWRGDPMVTYATEFPFKDGLMAGWRCVQQSAMTLYVLMHTAVSVVATEARSKMVPSLESVVSQLASLKAELTDRRHRFEKQLSELAGMELPAQSASMEQRVEGIMGLVQKLQEEGGAASYQESHFDYMASAMDAIFALIHAQSAHQRSVHDRASFGESLLLGEAFSGGDGGDALDALPPADEFADAVAPLVEQLVNEAFALPRGGGLGGFRMGGGRGWGRGWGGGRRMMPMMGPGRGAIARPPPMVGGRVARMPWALRRGGLRPRGLRINNTWAGRRLGAFGHRRYLGFAPFFWSTFFFGGPFILSYWMAQPWFMLWLYSQAAASNPANYMVYGGGGGGYYYAPTPMGDPEGRAPGGAAQRYFVPVEGDISLPPLGDASREWDHEGIDRQRRYLEEQHAQVVRTRGLRVLFDPTSYRFFWARITPEGQALVSGAQKPRMPGIVPLPLEGLPEEQVQELLLPAVINPGDDRATYNQLGNVREIPRIKQLREERGLDVAYDRSKQAFVWILAPK